ncbi:PH domain-containing protein [Microbacterium sp. NPDC057407]|uniref:PH domain-containing protein n=1 Tax=Microbacterium sp. NPDC057407 TaxID=3346120 RepID=UPI00366B4CC5
MVQERGDSGFNCRGALSEQAYRYLNIRSVVEVITLTALALVSGVVFAPGSWLLPLFALSAALCAVGLLMEVPLLNRLEVRHTSFIIANGAVCIRRGRLIRREIVINSEQLLNVSILHGPLLRRMGLVKVKFTTIAYVEPFGPIPLSDALRMRANALRMPEGAFDEQH